MATPKQLAVVLALPRPVPKLLILGLHIVDSMTGNAYFPSPSPDLDLVRDHLTALAEAEVDAKSGALGGIEARDLALVLVIADMHALKGHVQTVADASGGAARAVITSSGMRARRSGARQKAQLAASMGDAPGLVVLRAKAAAKRAAYEWRLSDNGGQTWMALPVTNAAEAFVPGLTAGVTYWFEVRSTVRGKTSEWSQTVSFMAH